MLVRLSSICLTLALLAGSAAGQRYHTRTYTEADGLQSSTVHSATQDTRGCMWFATRAGTASYDGSTWTSYGVQDGLSAPAQAFIRVDDEGSVWTVGALTGISVARLEEGQWRALPHHVAFPVRQAVTAYEIYELNGRDYQFVGSSDAQLHIWDGDEWTTLHAALREPRTEVTAIVPWKDALLIATRNELLALPLNRLDHLAEGDNLLFDARELISGLPDDPVRGICRDRAQEGLWVVGRDWIGTLDADGFHGLEAGLGLDFTPVYTRIVATPDDVGGLYFGNLAQLLYFRPGSGQAEHTLETLERSSGLISGGATSVFVDRESNVWITGLRGITKLMSRRFASLSSEHGLHADEVSAILERRNGEIVLGHPGGLTFLEDPIRTVELTDVPFRGRVLGLAEDDDGTIWAAVNVMGLAEIRPGEAVRWHRSWAGRDVSVAAVHVDPKGGLWVAASNRLYLRQAGGSDFQEVGLPRSANREGMIRRIVGGSEGTVYVGTYAGGLFRIRDDGIDRWRIPEQDAHNGIFTLNETSDGTLWVGSGAGLWQIRAGKLEQAGAEGPTISRPVYQIVEDDERRLWFGTDNGIFRWNGQGIEHITARHGLIGAETNRAGGLLDSRGRVWIGMDRGVSVYRKEYEKPRPHLPTVELLTADVGGRLYPLDREISLAHDENTLIFRFRAISFVDEERVQFRVWLDGFDDSWESAHSFGQREVRYTNLSPGEYRFHVRAIDAEGRESVPAVSRRIVVGRPLWSQPWFGALAFALLAAGVYGVSRHMAQRNYAHRLEREVLGRTAELRTSEEATAAEKERLAVTLASIADGVAATDGEGRIVLWNAAAARLMGLPTEEARGRPLSKVLQLPIEPVVRAGRIIEESTLIGSKHGETRQLVVSGAPIEGPDGTPTGGVFAFRDVTDKNRVERELTKTQRLEALGVLAGGIAHDFNNLLTVVLGGLSLLETDANLGPRSRGLIRDVEGATMRARSLTEQLMTFSRGGAPVRRAASIGDVIRETASFALRGANVRAEVDLPSDLWVVEVDEGQISQVMNNLLINARQAMPDGGTVKIRGRNLARGPEFLEPGRYVEIRVADEGPGIAPEYLDHVFDPYFSTKEEGSGLGLATAHSIIEKHEGRLTVDAETEVGAAFRIYLPASIKTLPPRRRQEVPPRRGAGRILVMDDDHQVRVTIQKMVDSLGYETRGAADGAEALALYGEAMTSGSAFDAVLMDLTIPGGMGGKEAIGRLVELDPDATAVVVSGYSTDPVLADHASYGFRDRLDKPFVVEDLARVLERALRGTRSQGTGAS